MKQKTKTQKLVEFFLKHPDATAQQGARHAKCSYAMAHRMLSKRQTPIEVLTQHQWVPVEGKKFDQGKLPWHLLPPDALDAVLDALRYGADKYGARNWEAGMDWSRPFSALMRHMWAWWRGEDIDQESGKSHLAHAACCVLFLLAYAQRGSGTDDRSV